MVDDFKPDGSTRAHVAVTLSRDLPMQLVLRTPSHDIASLLDTIPRCRAVFLDTSAWSSTLSQGSSMITHEEFIDKRDQYQDLHILITNTLVTLNSRGIETFVESTNNACYSYTTWRTYEGVIKGQYFMNQLTDIPLHLIHTLIFKGNPKRTPRGIRLLDIWPHLPLFPYLRWLEISGSFFMGENPSAVPIISLPSLRNLCIGCAPRWYRWTEGDVPDLFSLLVRIHSPELRSLILNGSFYQLFRALGLVNDGVRPSSLTLSFLSIEGIDPRIPRQAPILNQLQQLTLDLFDPAWPSNEWTVPTLESLYQALQILLNFLSEGCDVELRGGDELHQMIQLDMPAIQSLEIIYRVGGYELRSVLRSPNPPQFFSLTVSAGSPESRNYAPLLRSAQRVILDAVDLDVLLRRRTWIGSAAMSVLDAGSFTMDLHSEPHSYTLEDPRRFRHITRLRMKTEVLKAFIEHFEMRGLQEITLCGDASGGIEPFEGLLSAMFKRGDLLARLSVLHLEVFPPWGVLTRFVASFNKPHLEGISRVILPGLPNPSMLRALVEAFENITYHYMTAVPYNDMPATLGCSACVGGGWTCYEDKDSPPIR